MKKNYTILLLVCILQSAHAQFFAEIGTTAQLINLKVKESPAMGAVSEIVKMSGGNPDAVLPKRVLSRTIAPKFNIGYRILFDEFNLLLSAGTSQDFNNSFRLKGSAAVAGKTYPYPETFSVRLRGYKTEESGISYGGEFCFDNQKSETLLANSNVDRKTIGLLNQISSDINLLGTGVTRNMQMNLIAGWQTTKHNFEFGVFGLFGLAGKSMGGHLDMKLRYYLGERLSLKNKIQVSAVK
ncbi:MAG: hypothetical protein JNL70_08405 [Saprospiraceae bacterium]|nr:hypothetical protein [Saprospiraceae bacterium]